MGVDEPPADECVGSRHACLEVGDEQFEKCGAVIWRAPIVQWRSLSAVNVEFECGLRSHERSLVCSVEAVGSSEAACNPSVTGVERGVCWEASVSRRNVRVGEGTRV